MNSNPFALAIAGLLLASCGGGDAANDAAPSNDAARSTDARADAAGIETPAPAAGEAAPAVVQGEQMTYAPGELLPGGAVDVLQREGWRPPA